MDYLDNETITATQANNAINNIVGMMSTAEQIDDSVNLAHPSLNNWLYKLNDKSKSLAIFVNSDSTGNGTDEFVYFYAQWLADNYPEYTVRYRIWNDTTNVYESPISLNTGTSVYFIDVWNFAVAGSQTYHCLNVARYTKSLLNITDTSVYNDVSNTIDLCIINHAHNVWVSPKKWDNSLRHAIFTEEFIRLHPFSSFLVIRQNPHRDDLDNKSRTESMVDWAFQKNMCIADVWSKFMDRNRDTSLYADNIHPSTNLGTVEAPTGTRLFLDSVLEQMTKKFSFTSVGYSSLLNEVANSINFNPNLSHTDNALPPDGYTVSGGTYVKDSTIFIDKKKGFSSKVIATGGTACYLRLSYFGADIADKIGKHFVVAIRMRTDDSQSETYGRVGLITSSEITLDTSIPPLNGGWHWRYSSIRMKATDTYIRVMIYLDSSTTVAVGKTIHIDKIILTEGNLPCGNSI